MQDVFDDLEALQAPDTDLLTTSRSSTVEARKPKKGEWFRVSGAHRPTPFLVYEEMRRDNAKTYIVTGEAARDRTIQGIARKRIVYVAINRFGEPFLSLVGAGDDEWSLSSRKGHQQAVDRWISLASNKAAGAYDITHADFTENPPFPSASYSELLRAAFGGRVIDRLDHPVALELLGKTAP